MDESNWNSMEGEGKGRGFTNPCYSNWTRFSKCLANELILHFGESVDCVAREEGKGGREIQSLYRLYGGA